MNHEVLPRIGALDLDQVRRGHIVEMLDRIVDSGRGITANRVLAVVRKFFNWCVERDLLPVSPCNGVKAPVAENTRDRVLTDEELGLLWLVSGELGYPFGPWLRLLMLTAQRRDEVAGMSWQEIDFTSGLWTIPRERTKNDRAHEVPLSPAARAILEPLPRLGSFVFSTTGGTPISGFGKVKARIDHAMAARRSGEPEPAPRLRPGPFMTFGAPSPPISPGWGSRLTWPTSC